jgi:hypothetical protein
MTCVVLQPIGGALDHYASAVERPVKFRIYAHLIPPTALTELNRGFPTGSAAMWG